MVARTELTDMEEGGTIHTILSGFARELDDLNFQMTQLRKVWSIDKAQGKDLDERLTDFPEIPERASAQEAAGAVTFSRSGTTGLVTIPIGTVVRVPNGGPEFETTVAGEIADGSSSSASISILAKAAGTDGNVAGSTITQLDAVAGVETVTNPSATTGGQAQESDEAVRDRYKLYLRSLPRGTPPALQAAALSATLEGVGSVRFAEVVELTGANLGKVEVYVDNGSGTIESTSSVTGQTVIASTGGGEDRFFLPDTPVKSGTTVTIYANAVAMVENTDYVLNYSTGQVTINPALYPSGLTTGLAITADYTYYTGLIAEAQKVIEGDPNDRENYPGYRAGGTVVSVLAPTVLQQTVILVVVLDTEYIGESEEVYEEIRSAINRYINSLGIAEDVILSSLIRAAKAVTGVYDVSFLTPTSNTAIGSGELARVQDANIDIS